MAVTRARAIAFAILPTVWLASCTKARTEVIVVADTEYAVPSAMDAFTIEVEGPDGAPKSSTASLASGEELPRTLGLVHEGGPLGPFTVTLTGSVAGSEVARRVARFDFVSGETLTFRLVLTPRCAGVSCGADETCANGACRPAQLAVDELAPWTGDPGRLDGGAGDGGAGDGGAQDDAPMCVAMSETCNGVDDDCDGATDEEFDLTADVTNCGRCGRVCDFQNGSGRCAGGECVIDACDSGFDSCDDNGANGCETNLGSSPAHCGRCDNQCRGFSRECCAGTCARRCM